MYRSRAFTPDQLNLYKAIKKNQDITSNELQRLFSVSRGSMYDRLLFMSMCGYIKEKIINKHGLKAYSIDKRRKI